MTRTQERLSSTKWRMLNSSWVLTPVLSIGTFTCAAFLYAGSRMRSRPVLLAGVGYSIFTVFVFSVSATAPEGADRTIDNVAFGLLLVVWIGGSLHALRVNRQFLVWKAGRGPEAAWYLNHADTPGPQAPQALGNAAARTGLAADQQALWSPVEAPGTGLPTTPARPSAISPPAAVPAVPTDAPRQAAPVAGLDLNTASEDDLRGVPGVGPDLAKRILAERNARGGFRAVEELSEVVPPHILVRIRDQVVVTAPSPGLLRRPGRIVDI